VSAYAIAPGTLAWLARHELRLSWRELVAMLTGGKRSRALWLCAAALVFGALLHILAYSLVAPFAVGTPDRTTVVLITGFLLLAWSLMLSQAVEMLTRAFYARADLDLVLGSPVASQKLFAVRILAVMLSTTFMAAPLAAPFINALAYAGGARWLGAYGVIVALGAASSAIAVALTVTLFGVLGPKRTRLVAQIIAAVIGAAFVIGIQAVAILATGTLSRFAALRSNTILAYAPPLDSPVFLPARAAMGNLPALLILTGGALVLLALSISLFASRFAEHAGAAAGVSHAPTRERPARAFRSSTPQAVLRRKEWTLLKRDPWLLSQTLMQVLYLLPPALLLWRNFGSDGALVVLVPVLVMAAGQLAGGLAWLAVSGEDAPDLVATAPVHPRKILRAKIEAVMGGVALLLAPLLIALAWASPHAALVTLVGAAVAAASATLIQLWFRTQAKRSHFRRRQTSSRLATFAEAFSSIAWAATAGLAAAGTWFALMPAVIAFAILAGTRLIRPRT
jgi:ABC-2 type transport system permease protein